MSIYSRSGSDLVEDVAGFLQSVQDAVGDGPVSICLADLDRFAAINAELGHDAGDAVLDAWVRVVGGSLPDDAVVVRHGGDEFAIALPGMSPENALIVLDEIRSHLAAHPVEAVGRTISATFGVAGRPAHAVALDDLLRCANAALMRGKREGGGRVAMYVEEKMVLKSNYYRRADLDRLARLANASARTEASLLREALDDLFGKYRETQ